MIQLRKRSGRPTLMIEALVGEVAQLDADAPALWVVPMAGHVRKVGTELQQAVDRFVQERELGRSGQEQMQAVVRYVAQVDERYQQWVHDHIDPLLGRERYMLLRALSNGRAEELSPVQKQANYLLAWAGLGGGLTVLALIAGLPTGTLSLLFGAVFLAPGFKLAYQKAVVERKLSYVHVGLFYGVGLYATGYIAVGAASLLIVAGAYKVAALNEAMLRQKMVNIFGQQPRTVWRVVGGVETEIPFEQVQAGDLLVFDAGQMIPVDGTVTAGAASVDQQMLTGEMQPSDKGRGDGVLAATVVLSGRIFVTVEKTGADTTAAQIGEILNRSSAHRLSIMEKAVANADRWLWPTLAGSGVAWLVSGPVGGLAMIGCNYMLNMAGLIPFTLLRFLNHSSQAGILVKEGDALEKLNAVDTVLFDKTGTLTLEQPHVVQVYPVQPYTSQEVLALAAAAEHRQVHPIAKAILAEAAAQALAVPAVEESSYEIGYGIQVRLAAGARLADGAQLDKADELQSIYVGSQRFMELQGIELSAEVQGVAQQCQEQGNSLVFVALGRQLIGVVELAATVRPEAQDLVAALKQRNLRLHIISGDQEAPTRRLATELGMDGYFANTLPEHKARLVEQLKAEGRTVCFIGDGINDAIALKKADVSISLAGATTAATDTAQVVLMNTDLRQLLTLFSYVDLMHGNLRQNFNAMAALSILAASSVLFLRASFWVVESLYVVSLLTAMTIASRPLSQLEETRSSRLVTDDGSTLGSTLRQIDRLSASVYNREPAVGETDRPA